MAMPAYSLPSISRNSTASAQAFRVLVLALLFLLLMLSGCIGGSSSDNEAEEAEAAEETDPVEDTQTLSGVVYNGPIYGATVVITDGSSPQRQAQLQTTTAADGSFSLEVPSADSSYRVEARGGTLNGQSYQGALVALCSDSPCHVTPYSTVVESLVRRQGFNTGDAKAQLASLLRFDGDPFARELKGNPVDTTDWDMAGVRSAIGSARGLQQWVTGMLAWIVQPGSPAPVGPIGDGGSDDGTSGPLPEPGDDDTNEGQLPQQWRYAHEELEGDVQDVFAHRFKQYIEENSPYTLQIHRLGEVDESGDIMELTQTGPCNLSIAHRASAGPWFPRPRY